jgi:hypothetical protein
MDGNDQLMRQLASDLGEDVVVEGERLPDGAPPFLVIERLGDGLRLRHGPDEPVCDYVPWSQAVEVHFRVELQARLAGRGEGERTITRLQRPFRARGYAPRPSRPGEEGTVVLGCAVRRLAAASDLADEVRWILDQDRGAMLVAVRE